MTTRLVTLALILALLCSALLAPAVTHAQPAAGGYTLPASGIVQGFQNGKVKGDVTLLRFDGQGGSVSASAVVSLTVSDDNTIIGNIRRFAIALPVPTIDASCDKMRVTFGVPNLSATGFDVALDPVTFDVAASDSPNRQLRQHLCVLSKLLEKKAPAGGVSAQLNQILKAVTR